MNARLERIRAELQKDPREQYALCELEDGRLVRNSRRMSDDMHYCFCMLEALLHIGYKVPNIHYNDLVEQCEGCNDLAMGVDIEGVPLCEECAKACIEDDQNGEPNG